MDKGDVRARIKGFCICVIGIFAGIYLHSIEAGLAIAAAALLWTCVQAEKS